MSWHYSQALAAAYSADSSVDSAPCAPSKSTTTPGASCSLAKTTEACTHSRSGTTCEPSMESHGVDWWTSSLAASRAKTSPLPEKARASTAPEADCGEKWRGSLARWDRDTSSWRTPQTSLLAGLDVFSETWPRWGMMRGGECSALSMPAHLTSGTGYGFGANWPTPDARDAQPEGLEAGRRRMAKYSTCGLQTAVKLWQTPVADDAVERKAGKWNSRGEPKLSAQVKLWPTPTAVTNTGGAALCKWGGSGARAKLRTMVSDAELNGALNPMWVEWLMGWPLGWTDLQPLETGKCREWWHWHGAF
jgi:hypothetical protein